MSPVDDPRQFSEVLRDWMARHQLSAYAVARLVGAHQGAMVTGWLAGKPVTYERAMRMAMAWHDDHA